MTMLSHLKYIVFVQLILAVNKKKIESYITTMEIDFMPIKLINYLWHTLLGVVLGHPREADTTAMKKNNCLNLLQRLNSRITSEQQSLFSSQSGSQ